MYKTILTYMPSAKTSKSLAGVASELAARTGARLIGAHNSAKLKLYGGIPADFLTQYEAQQREQADIVERSLTEAASARGVSYLWRHKLLLDTESFEDIVAAARTADLIVAAGRGEDDPLGRWYDLPVRLILETGRPVLLLPTHTSSANIGKQITIGWNRSRESARAAFDAIPLLRAAETVRVLSINPVESGVEGPTDDLVSALRQHGVQAEGAIAMTAAHSEAEELLKEMTRSQRDLLVMGCYGHSRLRQMILGGTTKYVLDHMTTPVLMSH
jgi:nucleotide-binding universal stress UspA family protein